MAAPALEIAKQVVSSKWFWIALAALVVIILVYRRGKNKGAVTNVYAGSEGGDTKGFDPRPTVDELVKAIKRAGALGVDNSIQQMGSAVAGWKPEYLTAAYEYFGKKYSAANLNKTFTAFLATAYYPIIPWLTDAIARLQSLNLK